MRLSQTRARTLQALPKVLDEYYGSCSEQTSYDHKLTQRADIPGLAHRLVQTCTLPMVSLYVESRKIIMVLQKEVEMLPLSEARSNLERQNAILLGRVLRDLALLHGISSSSQHSLPEAEVDQGDPSSLVQ